MLLASDGERRRLAHDQAREGRAGNGVRRRRQPPAAAAAPGQVDAGTTPRGHGLARRGRPRRLAVRRVLQRSEEHTSELQSLAYLVCRLLLEKKKKNQLKPL